MERATKEIEAADRYSEVDLPAQDLALGQDLRKGDQMKLQESQLWESGLHALWWLHGCWGRLARSGSGSAGDSRKLTSDVSERSTPLWGNQAWHWGGKRERMHSGCEESPVSKGPPRVHVRAWRSGLRVGASGKVLEPGPCWQIECGFAVFCSYYLFLSG